MQPSFEGQGIKSNLLNLGRNTWLRCINPFARMKTDAVRAAYLKRLLEMRPAGRNGDVRKLRLKIQYR